MKINQLKPLQKVAESKLPTLGSLKKAFESPKSDAYQSFDNVKPPKVLTQEVMDKAVNHPKTELGAGFGGPKPKVQAKRAPAVMNVGRKIIKY